MAAAVLNAAHIFRVVSTLSRDARLSEKLLKHAAGILFKNSMAFLFQSRTLRPLRHLKTSGNIAVVFILLWLTLQSQMPYATTRSQPEDDSVNCQTRGVAVGENATIKCNFHVDVNKTKHGFSVDTKPSSLPDTNRPKEILLCHWRASGNLECKVEEGVRFNYNVTDHMEVVLQQVRREFAGRYTCRTVPHDNRPVHSCYLTVHASDTSTTRNSNGTSTEQTINGVDSTHSCPGEEYKVPLIATVSCLAAMLIVAVVVIIYFYKRQRSNRRKAREQSTTETLLRGKGPADPTEPNHGTDRESSRTQAESADTRI